MGDRLRGLRAYCEARRLAAREERLCLGCGRAFTVKRSAEKRFCGKTCSGAARRGESHSEEWVKRQGAGVRRAWATGKYEGKPRPDYAVIAGKLRGRKRSKAACESTARAISAAWKRGVYDTEAVKANRKRLSHVGQDKEHMHRIRALRDMEKLKHDNSIRMTRNVQKWMADGTYEKHKLKRRLAVIGTHGFGCMKRGRLDHRAAKRWKVRDPYGSIHFFPNLREWSRRNQSLFFDDRPNSRMPFWARIAAGIKNLSSGRVNAATSYKGWVLVSVKELQHHYGEDLLGRKA